jgi:hypothetical protein
MKPKAKPVGWTCHVLAHSVNTNMLYLYAIGNKQSNLCTWRDSVHVTHTDLHISREVYDMCVYIQVELIIGLLRACTHMYTAIAQHDSCSHVLCFMYQDLL